MTEPDGPLDRVEQVALAGVEGGASHIVVRRPGTSANKLYATARHVYDAVHDAHAQLLISDRVDVAQVIPGVGAHLGVHSLPCALIRPLLKDRLIGASVHDRDEAVDQTRQGVDYLMFGHVYDTASHPAQPGRGLSSLRDVVEAVSVPVIAIGGITADRVDEVLSTGAQGVAVIRAISRAEDPRAATHELREVLNRADYPHLDPIHQEVS